MVDSMAASIFAARGVGLLLFRGLLHTVQLTLGRTLKAWEWPYFRMMSLVCLLAAIPIAILLVAIKAPWPEPGHYKWVALRGLFGAGSFVCSVLAAQLGAPLGDVEALRSINMVAAALLGWAFLQEQVNGITVVALICSVAGALFISQPEVLFGRDEMSSKGPDVWIGHLLALASGLSTAGVFVASRKAPGTSVWVQALSSHLMSSFAASALPMSGAVEDFNLAVLPPAGWSAIACFVLLFGNTFLSTVTLSAAAQWCTAAESAIVSTSAGMGFGFAAQLELFGHKPDRVSLFGAALMLVGVGVMASAQASSFSKPQPDTEKKGAEDVEMGPRDQAGEPLLLVDAKKGAELGLLPGASDASTCDYDDLHDLEVEEVPDDMGSIQEEA